MVVARPNVICVLATFEVTWGVFVRLAPRGGRCPTALLCPAASLPSAMPLQRKVTTQRDARTIAAAASTRAVFPLFECSMLAKDALSLMGGLQQELLAAGAPKQQQSRVELVVKLLRHAAGATLTSRSSANDGVLLRSVTALSSQATRQACSTVYQEKLEAARERDAAASKRSTKAGSSPNLSIWRLRHWAKSYDALQKDVQAGHQSAEDVEGLPAESAILVRTQPPREGKPVPTTKKLGIVEHPQPSNGTHYSPKEVQRVIHSYVCPKGTEFELLASFKNSRLRDHVAYWLLQGWLGGVAAGAGKKVGLQQGGVDERGEERREKGHATNQAPLPDH